MAGPITWRNVQGGSNYGASRMLDSAGDRLNTGLGALQKVLDQQRATRDENWDVTKENNTQAFLDRLSQFRDLDEFTQARDSGALREMVSGYGPQIDQSQVRSAIENRDNQIRTDVRETGEHQDYTRRRDERSLRDELLSRGAVGDTAGVQEILSNNELLDEGQYASQAYQSLYANRDDRRAASRNARQQEAHEQQTWHFNNEVDEFNATEQANDLVTNQLSAWRDQQQQNEKTLLDLAGHFGIPMDANGQPDFSRATEQQLQQYNMGANDLGVADPMSETQFLTGLTERVANIDGVSPQEALQLREIADKSLASNQSLSTNEQKTLQNMQTKLTDSVRDNIYYEENPTKPDQATAELMEKWQDDDKLTMGWSFAGDRSDLSTQISDALSEGITVDVDGEGPVKIKATKAMVDAALNGVDSPWFSADGSLEDNLRNMLTSEGYVEDFKEYANYRDSKNNLSAMAQGKFGSGGNPDTIWDSFRTTLSNAQRKNQ